jgi:hypothetical protein
MNIPARYATRYLGDLGVHSLKQFYFAGKDSALSVYGNGYWLIMQKQNSL